MRLREISIGVISSGLLAAGVALTVPVSEPAGVAMPGPSAPELPPPAPARPGARVGAVPVPAAKPAGTQWRDMHAKFVRAQSLRVFFYEAMRKPEDGAFYYAMQALQTCRLALDQDLQTLGPLRREAAAELQRRCDFTREGLQDAQRELGAARHLDLRADPLLGSVFDYLAADGAQGRALQQGLGPHFAALDGGAARVVDDVKRRAALRLLPRR